MKAHDWQITLRTLALFWVGMPALTYGFFLYMRRLAEILKPWANPKIIPFIPIPIPKRSNHVRIRVRRSVSGVRALGVPVARKTGDYSAAYGKADATYSWFSRNLLLFLIFQSATLILSAILLDDVKTSDLLSLQISRNQLNALIGITGVFASLTLALICFRRTMTRFSNTVANLGAIRLGFVVLEEIYFILRGTGSYLALDGKIAKFCGELTDFTISQWKSTDPERFTAVSLHVTAVQREIRKAASSVLKDGNTGLTEVARLHVTVLERLAEERWLALLDIDDADAPAPGLTEPSDERQERRNAWIVILGATAGAVALGLATSAGIPLAVSVPAALVFLLGPATLWGGRRLGMGSKDLMTSLKDSFGASNQQGASQPQQPSGPGGTT